MYCSKHTRYVMVNLAYESSCTGGALFPALSGVVAAESSHGVSTLQPILVGLFAMMALSWYIVPDPKKIGRLSVEA